MHHTVLYENGEFCRRNVGVCVKSGENYELEKGKRNDNSCLASLAKRQTNKQTVERCRNGKFDSPAASNSKSKRKFPLTQRTHRQHC